MKRISSKAVPLPPWLRIVRESPHAPTNYPKIRGPVDVFALMGPELALEEVESVIVLSLDTQSRCRDRTVVSRGTLDSSLLHPREVFRVAISRGAASIILVHNHPSGDPSPSAEDRVVTRQMVAAGKLLDIPVHDHVILAGDRWVSLATLLGEGF
jgi:DNA repair protein RadC